jgi:uncharacterized protein (DUF111 family)
MSRTRTRSHSRAASPSFLHPQNHPPPRSLRIRQSPRHPRLSAAGEAEAAIHSIPVEKVHFPRSRRGRHHRRYRLRRRRREALGVDRWLASPLNVGSGTVVCQHGTSPFPRPPRSRCSATRPSTPPAAHGARHAHRRSHPAHARRHYAAAPAMRIKASGYGAGGRDTPGQPNLLRLLIGEARRAARRRQDRVHRRHRDSHRRLQPAGARLRQRTAARRRRMGRLSRLRANEERPHRRAGSPSSAAPISSPLRDLLFRETTTIGLHWRSKTRQSLAREFHAIEHPGARQIKIARWPSGAGRQRRAGI